MPLITIDSRRLDHQVLPATRPGAPTLVFLHEGLGCIATWRDLPRRLATATGCGALVYSRYGYGASDPLSGPRRDDYLQHEALVVLPALLRVLEIADPVLVGHSDGASIALIHAGAGWPVRGLVAMAPHVFVEDITIAGIRAALDAFATTDLPVRLSRHHTDASTTFRGWSDTWLRPSFRHWNIEDSLAGISCPILLVQGEADEYATMAQLDAVAAGVCGPVSRLELAGCGHIPFRDRPAEVQQAIAGFVAGLP